MWTFPRCQVIFGSLLETFGCDTQERRERARATRGPTGERLAECGLSHATRSPCGRASCHKQVAVRFHPKEDQRKDALLKSGRSGAGRAGRGILGVLSSCRPAHDPGGPGKALSMASSSIVPSRACVHGVSTDSIASSTKRLTASL